MEDSAKLVWILLKLTDLFAMKFHKSYLFILKKSLPSYLNSEVNPEFKRFYPGGCHDIPYNYLFCYVSPREVNIAVTYNLSMSVSDQQISEAVDVPIQ